MGAQSLRDVLTQLNNSTDASNTITFSPSLQGVINLATALPHISKNVTLNGQGADRVTVQRSTANGTPNFNIFNIDPGVTAVITGLTISNGNAADGGGINNQGNLTLKDSAVTNNTATDIGGGIINGSFPPVGSPSLTVINCTISGNTNASGGEGAGGIDSEAGTLSVQNSTISGNQAVNSHSAGGIGVYGGTASIRNSTIASNTANDAGTAPSAGGLDAAGTSVTLFDTIVAGNVSNSANKDVFGTITSNGHNLIGVVFSGQQGATVSAAAGDQLGTMANPINANLGALQNNGGPTQTMALLANSPALDAGDNTNAPPSDQRGDVRVFNNTIDIGAYEAQSPTKLATVVTVFSDEALAGLVAGEEFHITVENDPPVTEASTPLPTGAVHIFINGNHLTDGNFASNINVFEVPVPNGLPAGQYTITAHYDGDTNFAPVTGSFSFTVGAVSSPPPSLPTTPIPPLRGNVTADIIVSPPTLRPGKGNQFTEVLTIRNNSGQPIVGPLRLVVQGLKNGIKLRHGAGFVGSGKHKNPFVFVNLNGNVLQPGDTISVTLIFTGGHPKHLVTEVLAG